MLTEEHKSKCGCCFDVFEVLSPRGRYFFDQILIVTGDYTWVSRNIPESKRQPLEWHHSDLSSKPIKFKQAFSTQKVLARVYLDWKGVLLMEFMPKGQIINAASYCATLNPLRRDIQNHQRGQLSTGVVLLHNARPHTATSTHALLADCLGRFSILPAVRPASK
jgi:hypothetical protein